MRRSGSASCMLRPKNSLSSEDLQRLATWVKAGTPPTTVLTVVDNHKLVGLSTAGVAAQSSPASTSVLATPSPSRPSVSSSISIVDRLYILGELQAHANCIRFLCEDVFLLNQSTMTAEAASIITNDHTNNPPPPYMPPSIILYLLWRETSSAQTFVDGTVTDCVRRCLQVNGDEDASAPDDRGYGGSDDCECKSDEDSYCVCRKRRIRRLQLQQRHHHHGEKRVHRQLTRIYVVVDRISPPTPSAPPLFAMGTSQHPENINESIDDKHDTIYSNADVEYNALLHHRYNCEVALAKQLACAASTSTYLRERIDGITIGIASDDRSTPGLEACMDAIGRGAKERRKCSGRRRRQVGQQHRGRRSDCDFGGGGGISTWWTTPTPSSVPKTAKPTESYNDSDKQVDDDDDVRYNQRRRNCMLDHIRSKSPDRSPVAIVAIYPEDLERTNHDHHDHHHHTQLQQQLNATAINILQCRVSTEWNGNGECNSFTDRAMGDWREVWLDHHACYGEAGIVNRDCGIRAGRTFNCRPKVPRIWRGGGSAAEDHRMGNDEEYCNEPISTVMVIIFLVAVIAHVWITYRDIIQEFISRLSYGHVV
jgi:hypothetical protein